MKRVPDQIYVRNLAAGPVIRVEVPEFATKRSGHSNVEALGSASGLIVRVLPNRRKRLARELLFDYGSDDAPISG